MKIIKRNGAEATFDQAKIVGAVTKANNTVDISHRLTDEQVARIAQSVTDWAESVNRAPTVEEVQDCVESLIMREGAFEVAKKYIRYRYSRQIGRQGSDTDERILALIENNNEDIKQENSNKNPMIASVQRDYIAGEVSKDLTRRTLVPDDIMQAHDEGLIHFHDTDYFAQHIFNCCLINLEDMLQNGTVISGTMIERPHSFSTACNITTQIVAQVASGQYG